MKKWMCDACGYLSEGDKAPDACPKCKGAKFILQGDDKSMAEASLFSREVQSIIKFDSLLNQLIDTCDKGITANSCANCTQIFTKAKDDLNALKQLAKNEIKIHITKSNWG